MAKRKRRAFTNEFKAEAGGGPGERQVRPRWRGNRSHRDCAAQLGAAGGDRRGRGAPGALTTEERENSGGCRRENRDAADGA